ncbi:serine/threonine-protein phosphatase [Ectopseudomonas toyotomiensis]|uniref:Protein phosphatase n=1 Tax=Ectopseudomonas toyotomiensis TaxID=554344 RepID=A0A1I5VZV5_9GAMM|nr:protein phosphatase 2C domain-containing protein [Pseudomonas toyotomiensis]PIA72806.1 phosphoprotein phosphatase [Pseudomonas toyotomiensis]QSL93350.1 serine/threonine-protein phosphatase [Pseudomonas toyotomiensis]SFQ12963.1 protein phosphatase [Pseudomonas toyotomiensis]
MSQPSPVSVVFAAQSVAGQVRTHNEDAVVCRPDLGLWALADGMGGHARGEVASALALEEVVGAVQQGEELFAAVHAAHLAIIAAAQPGAGEAGMGSTLVAVRQDGDEFELAWVGDSRAYRIGSEHIEQLSHDHSWVQAMVDVGRMSAEEAREHPRRNVILQCLGQVGQAPEVGLLRVRLAPDELLLLCSDGLTNELDDAAIQRCCAEADTLEAMVEQLVGLANSHGGRDNISCIVLGLGPTTEPREVPIPGLLRKLFKSLQP